MRTWGRQAEKEKKRFSLGTGGMTLPEVVMASSLALLLLGLPLTWSIQGQQVIKACTVRSEELQELNHAMKVMTDTLQGGAVYLLEPHSQIVTFGSAGSFSQPWTPLPDHGSSLSPPESRLVVECFVDLYKRKEVHEFLLKDGYLLQRVSVKRGPGNVGESEPGNGQKSDSDAPVLEESGEQEEVLALNVQEVTFSCPVRGILQMTIKGERLLLTTQVRVKEGKEEE